MIFTGKENLSVMQINDEEKVTFGQIADVMVETPSNMIYCEKDGRLYGIISMGDIHRAKEEKKDTIEINTSFTYLQGYEYMRARRIFYENEKINALPIVDDQHQLIGDYSRWNDAYSGYDFNFLKGSKYADEVWKRYKKVAIVAPSINSARKIDILKEWNSFLQEIGIEVEIITKDKIIEAFDEYDSIFFTDEDEIRGLGTLYKDVLNKDFRWEKAKTLEAVGEAVGESMGEAILREIIDSGVYIITLCLNQNGNTYWKKVNREIKLKFDEIGAKNGCEVHKEFWRDFYDDLYSEGYALENGTQEYPQNIDSGMLKLKDFKGKYYNVVDGKRITVGQPKEYNNTVWFFGPCFVVGWRAEDANTIESKLQELINNDGIASRVVNCGCWSDEFQLLLRICSTKFKRGDVAIIYDQGKQFTAIPSIDLGECLERENIPAKWYWNHPTHPNHKVFELFAKEIYKYIPKHLLTNKAGEDIDKSEVKYSLMTSTYFERYFKDFELQGIIGSIVMNCNPFTKGHRFLIEEACKKVDWLIIFVVEEDKSLFSFKERYAMVVEGTKDLGKVIVVPSGGFILSQQTFPEYFIKVVDKDMTKNAEFDIKLFAESIAPKLNIKYRFVGEENNDLVTREYNQAMKKILPSHGIEVVEIPRKKMDGKEDPISATIVRERLEKGDWKGIEEIVPQSTMKILTVAWSE